MKIPIPLSQIHESTNRLKNTKSSAGSGKSDPLTEIQKILDSANGPVNYIQFKSILENTKGVSNPLQIIKEHTNNIDDLLNCMTNDMYPKLTHKATRSRITRLKNKIRKALGNEGTPSSTPANSDLEDFSEKMDHSS